MNLDAHYEEVWHDFLANKHGLCVQKIRNLLNPDPRGADDIIMTADFNYILGACEKDNATLNKALTLYKEHEQVVGVEHI